MNVNNEDAKIAEEFLFKDIKRYLENLDDYEDSALELISFINKIVKDRFNIQNNFYEDCAECDSCERSGHLEEIEDNDSSYTRMWLGKI